jgi:hypothetical protein
MLSLKRCREIDPELISTSDEELTVALEVLYGFAELAIDRAVEIRVPKIPLGSQIDSNNCGNV